MGVRVCYLWHRRAEWALGQGITLATDKERDYSELLAFFTFSFWLVFPFPFLQPLVQAGKAEYSLSLGPAAAVCLAVSSDEATPSSSS